MKPPAARCAGCNCRETDATHGHDHAAEGYLLNARARMRHLPANAIWGFLRVTGFAMIDAAHTMQRAMVIGPGDL